MAGDELGHDGKVAANIASIGGVHLNFDDAPD